MTIEIKKTPYEFMARWDDAGNLRGAHVVFREAVTEAGVEISSKIGEALAVSLAGGAGFPLAQILSALNTSAIMDSETKATEIAALKTAKTDADTARDAAVAEKDGKIAEVAALAAQLAALQPAINSFSRKAIKVALSNAALLDQFEATISNPQDDSQKLAMIAWEEDDTFTATSPSLVLTFERMKLTAEQITALLAAFAGA